MAPHVLARTGRAEPSRLLNWVRKERIAAAVRRDHAVKVCDLVAEFGVSDMTIRRDLAELSAQGLVRRVRGGAMAPAPSHPVTAPPAPTAAERTIATLAKKFVKAGSSIAMNPGPTTRQLALRIVSDAALRPLTVVTNSLAVAEIFHLANDSHLNVILTGGTPIGADALVGPLAERGYATHPAFAAFLDLSVSWRGGLRSASTDEATTNRAMVEFAGHSIVLAAGSRRGAIEGPAFTNLKDIDAVITHKGLSRDVVAPAATSFTGQLILA
ncbi:DeoR/GlpR family DNA-binding transcription regulator [Cellulosimicrobium cellulans]|uniref:DeoR/GlpR family DNA-binding transcription regulator n=1 Tax=Cellulosimicrobium cellulans TaxID=1710 RepID=UPI0036E8992A